MKMFFLCMLLGILASCTPQAIQVNLNFSDLEPEVMSEEALVEVSVLPKDAMVAELLRLDRPQPHSEEDQDLVANRHFDRLDDNAAVVQGLVEDVCDMIAEEAWRLSSRSILHQFVMKRVVLRPADQFNHDAFLYYGRQLSGYCQPTYDIFSGNFLHKVHFSADLAPLRRLSGVITVLHDDQTMAGMGSRAYVSLLEPEGLRAPLPVLIVQHQKGLAPEFVKVVGSGLITQLFGSQGQLEVLESTREISAGDHFFVVQVQGRYIQDEHLDAPYAPGVWRGLPTETVRPAVE